MRRVDEAASECGFHYCSCVVRSTDQETAAIEKISYYSQIPRGGGTPWTMVSVRVRWRQKEGGRKCRQAPLLWFACGSNGQGPASLNHVGGF
jgi:hypothetical protein